MGFCGEVGGYEKKEMKKAHGQKKGPKRKKKTTDSQVSHNKEASKQIQQHDRQASGND